nr:double-strand break repair protein MRE11 isoform X1 [Ipomoea trifida]
MEVDEWGFMTLQEKYLQLGYSKDDPIRYFTVNSTGLVELIDDFETCCLANFVVRPKELEIWTIPRATVCGDEDEFENSIEEYDDEEETKNSSEEYEEGSNSDSDLEDHLGKVDDLEYEKFTDANVEYGGVGGNNQEQQERRQECILGENVDLSDDREIIDTNDDEVQEDVWQGSRPRGAQKKNKGQTPVPVKLTKDGVHVSRAFVRLHCTLCKQAGHNMRTCSLRANNQQNGAVNEAPSTTEPGIQSGELHDIPITTEPGIQSGDVEEISISIPTEPGIQTVAVNEIPIPIEPGIQTGAVEEIPINTQPEFEDLLDDPLLDRWDAIQIPFEWFDEEGDNIEAVVGKESIEGDNIEGKHVSEAVSEKKIRKKKSLGLTSSRSKVSRKYYTRSMFKLKFHGNSKEPIDIEFGHVNYEDPHFNVGLPVFSIHGNHDDPAGVDNLSAVDILSACNLVNYFGKMDLGGSGVGQISLYPILIRKGSTSVALYGLGNIRDERLNRMFQTPHAVQWMRPEAQEECQLSDWFNILVLHQNRVKTNPKNAINEHFLPRFLDFIVWGHEHECLVDPQEVPGMGFHITQPGSSVATSLIDGESKPKHVLLLEIKIVLKDEPDIDPNDQNSILEHLDNVVRKLIERSIAISGSENKLPLVRVKVDYSGFMTINPQRFGQKYVGKVANPQDILIFSKSSNRGRSAVKIEESERLRPEELNQQNIEALVAESNLKMEILPVNDLDVALHSFVNKDDKMAFYSCVQYNLKETRERVKERAVQNKDDQPFSFSGQSSEIRSKSIRGIESAVSFSDDEDTTPFSASKSTANKGKKELSQSFRSSSVRSIAEDEENVDSDSSDEKAENEINDVDDSLDDETLQGKGRKRAAPRGKGRGNKELRCSTEVSATQNSDR